MDPGNGLLAAVLVLSSADSVADLQKSEGRAATSEQRYRTGQMAILFSALPGTCI